MSGDCTFINGPFYEMSEMYALNNLYLVDNDAVHFLCGITKMLFIHVQSLFFDTY